MLETAELLKVNEIISENLLKSYKPILVVYIPDIIFKDKNAIKINKIYKLLRDELGDKYFLVAIPSVEDDIKLEMLSILKSKTMKDEELKKYLDLITNKYLNEQ